MRPELREPLTRDDGRCEFLKSIPQIDIHTIGKRLIDVPYLVPDGPIPKNRRLDYWRRVPTHEINETEFFGRIEYFFKYAVLRDLLRTADYPGRTRRRKALGDVLKTPQVICRRSTTN